MSSSLDILSVSSNFFFHLNGLCVQWSLPIPDRNITSHNNNVVVPHLTYLSEEMSKGKNTVILAFSVY